MTLTISLTNDGFSLRREPYERDWEDFKLVFDNTLSDKQSPRPPHTHYWLFRSLDEWPPGKKQELKKLLRGELVWEDVSFHKVTELCFRTCISWADAMVIASCLPREDLYIKVPGSLRGDDLLQALTQAAIVREEDDKLTATWNVGQKKVSAKAYLSDHDDGIARDDFLGYLGSPSCKIASFWSNHAPCRSPFTPYDKDRSSLSRYAAYQPYLQALINNQSVADLEWWVAISPESRPALLAEMASWGEFIRDARNLQSLSLQFCPANSVESNMEFPDDWAQPIFEGLASETCTLEKFNLRIRGNDRHCIHVNHPTDDLLAEWTKGIKMGKNYHLQSCSLSYFVPSDDQPSQRGKMHAFAMPMAVRLTCELNKAAKSTCHNHCDRTREHWVEVVANNAKDKDFLNFVLKQHPGLC